MRKKIMSLMLVLLMILGSSTCIFANEIQSVDETYTITEPYVYPIIPGTEEWRDLGDTINKIEACQIPEDILKNMTTEALAETVMNYPLLLDLLASNSPDNGFNNMVKNFNGLQELTTREDAGQYLTNFYLNDDSKLMKASINKGEAETKNMLFEILSRQFELNHNATAIKGIRGGIKYSNTNISTKAGTSITVKKCTQDYSAEQLEYMDTEYGKMYPDATLITGATAKYNCYNYAFNNKSKKYWMPASAANVYMTDGSYSKNSSSISSGNIVYYVGGDHAGIVTSVGNTGYSNVTVTSKWGPYALYSHRISQCPSTYLSGGSFTFWK